MVSREHANLIRQRLNAFPAVAILGPRQCGKTTLARQFGGTYLDLEQEGAQARLDAQWEDLTDRQDLRDQADVSPIDRHAFKTEQNR